MEPFIEYFQAEHAYRTERLREQSRPSIVRRAMRLRSLMAARREERQARATLVRAA